MEATKLKTLSSKKLSVFIISSHHQALFQRCVESALRSLPNESEVTIILNGEQREKLSWLGSLSDDRITVIQSEQTCVSHLRNRAFYECAGEIIHFIDDDVIVPPHLFQNMIEAFEADPDLAIVGGPNLTPPGSSFVERLGGAALTSPFAAPFVYRRYTNTVDDQPGVELSFILCNFAIRKRACSGKLNFYPGLYPNEENLFLHRARRLRLKSSFRNSLYVYHHRRGTLLGMMKQIAGYGFGRCRQTLIEPLSFPVPFLFLISAFLGIVSIVGASPSLAFAYSIGALAGWLRSIECRRLGVIGFLLAPALSFGIHVSYAVGFSRGVMVAIRSYSQSHRSELSRELA